MGKTFYSADLHFNHANIIKYCKRPFHSVDEMNSTIISNIQSTVTDEDDFWILGDFAFGHNHGATRDLFDKIPGKKHLIVGNHDGEHIRNLPWESVNDLVEFTDGNTKVVLCHYPMLSWNKIGKGAINLFGHVHNNWFGSSNAVNVGVDCFDFKPVHMGNILKRAKENPQYNFYSMMDSSVK